MGVAAQSHCQIRPESSARSFKSLASKPSIHPETASYQEEGWFSEEILRPQHSHELLQPLDEAWWGFCRQKAPTQTRPIVAPRSIAASGVGKHQRAAQSPGSWHDYQLQSPRKKEVCPFPAPERRSANQNAISLPLARPSSSTEHGERSRVKTDLPPATLGNVSSTLSARSPSPTEEVGSTDLFPQPPEAAPRALPSGRPHDARFGQHKRAVL